VNITYPTTLVLQALARGIRHGFDIIDATGLASGTVYPILRRLDHEGFVHSRWERESVAHREQRPPRRYYELTAQGQRMLAQSLERHASAALVIPRAPAGARPQEG